VHIRNNGKVLDATKYAGTTTCAYEQAALIQKDAHRHYMIAIGLKDTTLKDTVVPPKKKSNSQKKKTNDNTKTKRKYSTRKVLKVTKDAARPEDDRPEDDLTEDEGELLEPKKADAVWLKCRNPQLTAAQLDKLTPALKALEGSDFFQPRFPRAKYYAFAHRVCRAYVAEWTRQESDPIHINRVNMARSAVASVLGKVRPWTDKPHHGNTHQGMFALLPAIEGVLDIPSYAFLPGSKRWLTKITTLNRSVHSLTVLR
jgi:hypothetical protein